jgi:hypothetical protein
MLGVATNPRLWPADADKSVITLWRERHAVNRRELERLGRIWKGPLAELPLVPLDRGPALVETLVETLVESLEREVA